MRASVTTDQVIEARTPSVELVDVTKAYDGPPVVHDLNLDVVPGELLTLLGPSGCGKTTTLMMVAGFERPTKGIVRLDGKQVVGIQPQQRNLGIVFQNYALFPHKSVLDNVAFPLQMRGMARRERRAQALSMLERVGLAELANRRPRQLSGGQQQRVALARALVFQPVALLLDEPLGALDRGLRDRMQLEIKRIQSDLGVAVINVTHDQEEAMAMSDRIAVMRSGYLEQVGPPGHVYHRPANLFVASFMGDMNMFACSRAARSGSDTSVTLEDGSRCVVAQGSEDVTSDAGVEWRVCVRPERVEIVREAASGDAGGERYNAFHGTISEEVFLGSSVRYLVRALGKDVIVRRPTEGVPDPIFDVGERVVIRWAAEDGRLLPVEQESS